MEVGLNCAAIVLFIESELSNDYVRLCNKFRQAYSTARTSPSGDKYSLEARQYGHQDFEKITILLFLIVLFGVAQGQPCIRKSIAQPYEPPQSP